MTLGSPHLFSAWGPSISTLGGGGHGRTGALGPYLPWSDTFSGLQCRHWLCQTTTTHVTESSLPGQAFQPQEVMHLLFLL
jgi:hypothetical protein